MFKSECEFANALQLWTCLVALLMVHDTEFKLHIFQTLVADGSMCLVARCPRCYPRGCVVYLDVEGEMVENCWSGTQ